MNCLLVDADPSMTLILTRLIQRLGYTVSVATSVQSGFRAIHTNKFDLLVFDYLLPDGTSVELSTLASVTQPNCRIILLTGSPAFPEGEHAVIAPGIDWVLRRPAALGDFAALVDYAARDAARHPTPAHAMT